MLTDAQSRFIATATRTMQIIIGALAFGVISFFGIVFVLPGEANPGQQVLSNVTVVVGAAAIILSVIVSTLLARKQVESLAANRDTVSPRPAQADGEELGDVPTLVGIYQTQLIVRAAILDGAAFFALVAFMLERQSSSLSAAAALVLFILFLMPTCSRVEDWIERQRANIAELRQFGTE